MKKTQAATWFSSFRHDGCQDRSTVIVAVLSSHGVTRTFLQTTTEGRLPSQFTLTELEERLALSGFFRAHRGYLVNLQHVKAVIPYTRNSFSLILDDESETEIPLSKSAARELRELLDY